MDNPLRGKRRDAISIEEDAGLESGRIYLKGGGSITLLGGLSYSGVSKRGIRSNFCTIKDENGDIIEMDTRDGSCRVVYTAEELEGD